VSDVRARTKRPTPSSPEADAIEVIDGALIFAGRRQIFTAAEALQLLRGVENKVDETALTRIAPIATTAVDSYRDDDLVDRSRVVDPLLDMRLVLSD